MRAIQRVLGSVVLLLGTAAWPFNSDEHKRIGDEGSAAIPICATPQQTDCRPARLETTARSGSGKFTLTFVVTKNYEREALNEVKLVETLPQQQFKREVLAEQPAYEAKYMTGQTHYMKALYVPPPGQIYVPLLVWTGSASNPTPGEGQWFTFGDLMAIYGDYRRAVTCGKADTACLLSDKLTHSTPVELGHLRNFARGEVPPFGSWGNTFAWNGGTPADNFWWGDEMLRLAYTNDWHFNSQAIRWYVGMHRQALYHARLAAETRDQIHLWKALHYEANGLHSLTDLFAPGHVITSRAETVAGIFSDNGVTKENNSLYEWFQKVFDQGKTTGYTLAPLPPPNRSDIPSWSASWVFRMRAEEQYHTGFNNNGSQMKNAEGDQWTGFGDGKLFPRQTAKGDVVELTQFTVAKRSVGDSLKALFNAYGTMMREAGSLTGPERTQKLDTVMARISSEAGFYAALRNLPIELKNLCFDTNKCCAVSQWEGIGYRDDVLTLLGKPKTPVVLLPVATGSDWKSVCKESSTQTETARLNVPVAPIEYTDN